MKMPWNRECVRVLPVEIDLSKQPWCREALLLNIRGSGALRWESRVLPPGVDSFDIPMCLTLRGTPLVSCLAAICETSESWLCAGWGLDTVECPELEALREALNGGITRLEDAVSALSPLLKLLPEGIYVLAESDAYPTNGSGQFFWEASDCLKPYPATAAAYLNDDDYKCRLERIPPLFLYPSQRRSRLDVERVKYYKERFQESDAFPHGFALHVMEGMSVLLDGHHKAAAAALLGRSLPCITVFPLDLYLFRPVTAAKGMEKMAAGFGPFVIPVEDLRGIALPEKPGKRPGSPAALPKGRLKDAELPEALLNAVKRFPTAGEYALLSAAGISNPTDKELETWLVAPENFRPQLRGALVYLRSRGDPRLKSTALRCAAVKDYKCSLKKEAFKVLEELKGDPEVETFFIDYFVDLEEEFGVHGGAQDCLTQIAHSFWN